MIYRNYGSTGVEVSAIGFGGMRFENQHDVEACASLMKIAYDSGINYFDTAPTYGKSEEIFGVALKEMKKTRDKKPFYVSTKSIKDTPDQVRQDLETSLKRMGLDYIDFYHVWYIKNLDVYRYRKANGVLKEFERLKDEGLVRHICVSTHMTGDEIGEMMQDYPFEGILLGYSAMNFAYRDKGLDIVSSFNRGVVVMNPLGGGIIPQHPSRFGFLKINGSETVVEGALRFLLNDSRITIALVGFGNQQHLQEAIDAVNKFQPLNKRQVQSIRDNLNASFNELCTGCRYCDKCPEGIPVPKLMDAYNHLMLSGNIRLFLDRLYWHWSIQLTDDFAAQCQECGICEEACTQNLPIIERIKKIGNEQRRELNAKEKQ